MAQQEVSVTIAGVTPLLMHEVARAMNPKNPLTQRMKQITSKRGNKTDEDRDELADLEYRLSAYTNKHGRVYMPGECLDAVILGGAKQARMGPKAKAGVLCDDGELVIPGSTQIDDLVSNPDMRDVRCVVVQRQRILRTRPRFDDWRIRFGITVETQIVDTESVKDWLVVAGRLVGLCDYRPRFGRFVVETFEVKAAKAVA